MTGGHPNHKNSDKRSAGGALLLSFVLPWRASGGAWRDMGAVASLGSHALGLLVFGLGLLIVDHFFWWDSIIRDIQNALENEPGVALLVIAIGIIGLELLYLLAAWWTACWGAGTERYRHSYGRSLARWYQLTPFHALWTLLLFVSLETMDEVYNSFYSSDSFYDWKFARLLVDLIGPTILLVYCTVGGVFTLMTLAVHRDRPTWHATCRWPAVCEGCGYALAGLTYDQSCPECGRSVDSSLHTPRGTLPKSLTQSMLMASTQPTRFGSMLLARTQTRGPARAMGYSAAMLFCCGPIGMTLILAVTWVLGFSDGLWIDDFYDLLEILLIGGTGMGIAIMCIGVTLMLGAGSLVAFLERYFGQRSNMPAAAQASCYTGGLLVFGALAMCVFSALLVTIAEQLDNAGLYSYMTLLPLAWLVVFVIGFVCYLFILWRIVRAARHANV